MVETPESSSCLLVLPRLTHKGYGFKFIAFRAIGFRLCRPVLLDLVMQLYTYWFTISIDKAYKYTLLSLLFHCAFRTPISEFQQQTVHFLVNYSHCTSTLAGV